MKSFRASPRLSPFRPQTLCQRFYTTKTLTGRKKGRHSDVGGSLTRKSCCKSFQPPGHSLEAISSMAAVFSAGMA